MKRIIIYVMVVVTCFLFSSCIKKGIYKGDKEGDVETGKEQYIYPFRNEDHNVVAEITIQTDGKVDLADVGIEIPKLKYNKSWLFLLSQDDCKHAAFSCTWAAINGKPLSDTYYYDIEHLMAGDLPPDVYYLGKTLGSTDGAGNEVRFSFTTTLSPEWDWMDAKSDVKLGFKNNYYRFFMKSGLTWRNVIEMLNYGTSVAFHDVNTQEVNNADTIKAHYAKSQDIILDRLSGRGCKVLAEPNGNKTYVQAARDYEPIQIMTAQSNSLKVYPFSVKDDLKKALLKRVFTLEDGFKTIIEEQLKVKKEERRAIQAGFHETGKDFVEFLLWLNDTYGKDGDDSVWFTSIEEYFEYNYYRIHASIEKEVEENLLKIKVRLPSGQYFYYPSVTLNLKGLDKQRVLSVSSGNSVKGLSSGAYEDGMMINIDCRKYLVEHAIHFIERYEENPSNSNREDALYFVSMLKDSDKKNELLRRIK